MQAPASSSWMKYVLAAAGFYNLAWCLFMSVAPQAVFNWAGMVAPNYPELWQGMGMLIGAFGILYWIAARDPMKYRPIVAVGLLTKILAPLGAAQSVLDGRFAPAFLWLRLPND